MDIPSMPRLHVFLMLLSCTAALSNCNKVNILRMETVELTQKIAEEEQKLRQTQAQLMAMGHLGVYENAGPQEMATAKAQVEGLVNEKKKLESEIEREKAVLEELKGQLQEYQSKQFKTQP